MARHGKPLTAKHKKSHYASASRAKRTAARAKIYAEKRALAEKAEAEKEAALAAIAAADEVNNPVTLLGTDMEKQEAQS